MTTATDPRVIEKYGPAPYARITRALSNRLPKRLYPRAIIIITAPLVLLQSVLVFVFMERHWDQVTRRLSTATTRDIAALIDVYHSYPHTDKYAKLIRIARDQMALSIQILPPQDLPKARPKPFFDLLDRALSDEIRRMIAKPFWIDTVGRSKLVEIRIKLDDAVFRVIARRSQTYASNSHIFLVWMVGTSIVLLIVAILFLRNQIRPILSLAKAVDNFGKGRPVPHDFRPRGAQEVRQAAQAFMKMRDRIERHVEQRTTLLAGVSHDLRTILTRFKLELALAGDSPELAALRADVDEMQAMLEDYMAFTKGDGDESIVHTNIRHMLNEIGQDSSRAGKDIEIEMTQDPIIVPLRQHAFKRAIGNLVNNAARFSEKIVIAAETSDNWLTIAIDDNGPGIPVKEREQVFRPFYRLDHARNQNEGSTGLGLSIARDIAQSHGGDITLQESPLGGLKALVKVPV